jgi:hypothetical protein
VLDIRLTSICLDEVFSHGGHNCALCKPLVRRHCHPRTTVDDFEFDFIGRTKEKKTKGRKEKKLQSYSSGFVFGIHYKCAQLFFLSISSWNFSKFPVCVDAFENMDAF